MARPPWDQPEPEFDHFPTCWHSAEGQREWAEHPGNDPLPPCNCRETAEDLAADYVVDLEREEPER